jgi:UDP-hydrolysing UDP-N-acetyl-D-glucosamine 2-epimerase
VIHLHGGEETEGAIDNALRHAITKMSHLHLVSHAEYAQRIAAMGEDPASIHVVGAPGLDNIHRDDLPGREQLAAHLGLALEPPLILVTVHPTTLAADPAAEAVAVAAAMDEIPATYIVTLPNADPGNERVRSIMLEACKKPRRMAAAALGEQRYWGLLRTADAMVGNSSSAVIEAPVVALPAVNVGDRQRGRLRGANLIDCRAETAEVASALRRALDPGYRATVRAAPCPFGDGHSADEIVRILSGWAPPRPPVKRRIDARQA